MFFKRTMNMAPDKNTKDKASSGGSQAGARHDGLMELESRLLFSAVPLVAALPGQSLANGGATAIEAGLLPGDMF
jgi:hypothetical protein